MGRAEFTLGRADRPWNLPISRGLRRLPGLPLSLLIGLALFASGGEDVLAGEEPPRYAGVQGQAANAVVQPMRANSAKAEFEASTGPADRVPVPPDFKTLHEAVGVLIAPESDRICTAFCVSPDIIATAGHCLDDGSATTDSDVNGSWAGHSERVFSLGRPADRRYARIGKFERGISIVAARQTENVASDGRVNIANDWALARLASPICTDAGLVLSSRTPEEVVLSTFDHMIFAVAPSVRSGWKTRELPRSNGRQADNSEGHAKVVDQTAPMALWDLPDWMLFASPPCRLVKNGDGASADYNHYKRNAEPDVLLHNCDLGKGSSGSPLLMATPSGLEIVGIGVGRYKRSLVTVRDTRITKRFRSDHVASAAIAASVLRRPLRQLQSQKTAAPN